jgi:hypothetical protein
MARLALAPPVGRADGSKAIIRWLMFPYAMCTRMRIALLLTFERDRPPAKHLVGAADVLGSARA